MKKERPDQKTTNEKPVSLYPLPFGEVVRDLLVVKPPPKDGKQRRPKKPNS